MTALERVRRKQEKSRLLHKTPTCKKMRSHIQDQHHSNVRSPDGKPRRRDPLTALGGMIRRRWTKPRRGNERSLFDEPSGPLEIDSRTYKLMRVEVEVLIAGSDSKSVTLYDAVTAMKSRQVHDSFAIGATGKVPRWRKFIRNEEAEKTKRRYELELTLDRIQATQSSCDNRISSWEDVEEACRPHMSFPAEYPTVEGSLGDMQRLIQSLKDGQMDGDKLLSSKSQETWRELEFTSLTSEHDLDKADRALLERYLDKTEKRADRLKSQELQTSEERLLLQEREVEAEERASSLLRDLSPEEKEMVQEALYAIGPEDDVIAKTDTDMVCRKNMYSLQPGQWLSDEIIHFFLAMLAKRDEELCLQDTSRRRSHFFKSFFMTKLLNEGHMNPSIANTYDYKNVKRWSKKVPGKDIFNLEKIIFPINVGEVHWVCAVAFMQEKRIQYYDSFGGDGMHYLQSIFRYIKDEHRDKKNNPLPDEDKWQLMPCAPDTPRQGNGFDCGVFTCMFADFVSKDCPLVFGQDHVNQCRERITLSILQGTAIM